MRTRLFVRAHDEGSVLIALLAMLAVGTLTVALLGVVISGSRKTRFDETYASTLQSADAGVQLALTQIAQLPSTSRPASLSGNSTLDGVTYDWTATSLDGGLTYNVSSSSAASSADVRASRTIAARIVQNPRFKFAAFAEVFLEMGSANNNADSYDSRDLSKPSSHQGFVGTNGNLNVRADNVDGYVIYDSENATKNAANPDRVCNGAAKCTNVPTPYVVSTDFIDRTLSSPTCPSSPTPFKASDFGGVIPPGIYCATTVSFDVSTVTLRNDVSPSNPVIIYATGSIGSSNSVSINMNTKSAASLQLYTNTTDDIAFGNHGNIAAAIYAPKAGCPKATNAQTAYWGSLVCRQIDTNGGWDVHYDEALGSLGDGVFVIKDFAEVG